MLKFVRINTTTTELDSLILESWHKNTEEYFASIEEAKTFYRRFYRFNRNTDIYFRVDDIPTVEGASEGDLVVSSFTKNEETREVTLHHTLKDGAVDTRREQTRNRSKDVRNRILSNYIQKKQVIEAKFELGFIDEPTKTQRLAELLTQYAEKGTNIRTHFQGIDSLDTLGDLQQREGLIGGIE